MRAWVRPAKAKGNFWRPMPPKSRLGHQASARMGKDQQRPKAIFGDQCRQKVALAIELRRAWVKTSKGQRQFLETRAAKNCLWPLLVFTHARRISMAKATFWRHWSPKIAFGLYWSLPMRAEQQKPRRLFGGTGLQKLPLAFTGLYPCAPKLDGQGDFLAAPVSNNCLWPLLVFTHARRSSMAKATFWRHWSPTIAFGLYWSLPMRAEARWPRRLFGGTGLQQLPLAFTGLYPRAPKLDGQGDFLATSAAKKSPWPSSFGAHGKRPVKAKGSFWRPVPPKSRLGHRASARMGKDQ